MRFLPCFLPFLLFSCSGGSDSDPRPPTRSAGTLSGLVSGSPLSSGRIKVYEYSNGVKGPQIPLAESSDIAVTTTDGNYSVDLVLPDQLILLEVDGGNLVDELSGETIANSNAQSSYRAIVDYRSGEPHEIHISALTTWAACLSDFYVSSGVAVDDAVFRANTEISNYIELSLTDVEAIYHTAPANALLPIGSRDQPSDESLLHGYLSSGLSGIAATYAELNQAQIGTGVFNPIRVIQLGCSDLRRDGLFNGLGEPTSLDLDGVLSLGSTRDSLIDANFYRATLARGVMRFASSENNRAGLLPNDLYAAMDAIANDEGPLFDGADSVPIDDQAPVIQARAPSIEPPLLPLVGQFSYAVSDETGIGRVDLYLDDAVEPFRSFRQGDPALSTKPLTLPYDLRDEIDPDGSALHSIRLVISDVVPQQVNESEDERVFRFASQNTPFLTSSLITQTNEIGTYLASGSFISDDSDPVISVTVLVGEENGVPIDATFDTDAGTWEAEINLTEDVYNVINIESLSESGLTYRSQSVVGVDNRRVSLSPRDSHFLFNYRGGLDGCYRELHQFISFNNDIPYFCFNLDNLNLPSDGDHRFNNLERNGYNVALWRAGDDFSRVFTENDNITAIYEYYTCSSFTDPCLNAHLDDDSQLFKDIYTLRRTGNIPRRQHYSPDVLDQEIGEHYYMPITAEFLGENFHLQDTTVHRIKLRFIDEAGNENSRGYIFRVVSFGVLDIPIDVR